MGGGIISEKLAQAEHITRRAGVPAGLKHERRNGQPKREREKGRERVKDLLSLVTQSNDRRPVENPSKPPAHTSPLDSMNDTCRL